MEFEGGNDCLGVLLAPDQKLGFWVGNRCNAVRYSSGALRRLASAFVILAVRFGLGRGNPDKRASELV
jgi:hypothetical protein